MDTLEAAPGEREEEASLSQPAGAGGGLPAGPIVWDCPTQTSIQDKLNASMTRNRFILASFALTDYRM